MNWVSRSLYIAGMTTQRCPRLFHPGPQSRYRDLPIIGPNLDELLGWFRGQGYAEGSICNIVKATVALTRWLQQRRGAALGCLGEQDLNDAYDHFRACRPIAAAAARAVTRFLREHSLIRVERPKAPTRSERQIHVFSEYLRDVRGLSPTTIIEHQRRVRLFLQFLQCDERPAAIRNLSLKQVETFLIQSAKRNNRFSLQHVVGTLRAFLRHQHAQGFLEKPLHDRIDRPRTYRLEQLPRAVSWERIIALLRSIDRSTPRGLRDYTLLYFAAFYGLRSGEVVRLSLDDIDWRAKTLRVTQTKSKQFLLLPLTDEAGHILARYLKIGRPPSACRELFLRHRAPAGPLAPTAVHDILTRRITLSGLDLPPIGPHALRHSLAVHLLRRGTCLPTIGATLGHRDPESTAVYLRLAIEDLRDVGLPVPNGGSPAPADSLVWKPRLAATRENPKRRLTKGRFQSGMAVSLRRYLESRRALGRIYKLEEGALRDWDHFVCLHFGSAREVHAPMFQRWAESMPDLHPTVRRNRMRIVRNFLLYRARHHPLTYIPDLATFPKPGAPQRSPRLVSPAEMARILATTAHLSPTGQNPLRADMVRLGLILLFCCGLRRREVVRLRLRDVDLQENFLRIEETKFHKSRLVPLSDSVADELRRYLALCRAQGSKTESETFLLWSNRPQSHIDAYNGQALSLNWQLLCQATGVLNQQGKPPRLHDLRHSFAVEALNRWYGQGITPHSKLQHLATYLGHVSPVSTYHYLRLSPELRQAASRRFHGYAANVLNSEGTP